MDNSQQQQPQTVLVHGKPHTVPDLSHHLSVLAKNRQPSPLKQLAKYLGDPTILMLAGGMPHPEYFPYDSLSAKVLAHDAYPLDTSSSSSSSTLGWLWDLVGFGSSKPKTDDISVPKYGKTRTDNQLAVSLQYGTSMGIAPLLKFTSEFVHKVHKPYLATTTTVMTTGNTDGWNRAVETLCNRGDGLLVEEWSYPSAIFTSRPHGVNPVPIAMDLEGMRDDALETVLRDWNEEARGFRRPHVMYLVPIGQNPSGATMSAQRKRAIYEICVKYDIIIVEDDPYYFLQEGPYVPQSYRKQSSPMSPEEWVDTLSPSFLRFDYDGRVIRLDTFSKTIAPGSRLGWVTASPLFADRVLRVGEVSTQAPCGFGQSMVAELLVNHWGYDKYVRWLQGLQKQYTDRRDMFIDAIAAEFDVFPVRSHPSFLNGAEALGARGKQPSWTPAGFGNEKKKDTWFSFIPPTSGMFVWVRVHLENHPSFGRTAAEKSTTLEEELFAAIAEKGLLVGPGWIFATKVDEIIHLDEEFAGDSVVKGLLSDDPSGNPADHDPSQYAHFRISFSSATEEEMSKAMRIFATVLRDFFNA